MIIIIKTFFFLHLFPQRTSPTETDRRIQSKLGDFQSLKQLIERDSTHGSRLVGVSSSQMRSSNPIPSPLPPQQVSSNKINVFAKVFDKLFSTFSIYIHSLVDTENTSADTTAITAITESK